jgi:hypothetical protein
MKSLEHMNKPQLRFCAHMRLERSYFQTWLQRPYISKVIERTLFPLLSLRILTAHICPLTTISYQFPWGLMWHICMNLLLYIHFFNYCCTGGTLWHSPKFLQYVIVEFTPPSFSFIPYPHSWNYFNKSHLSIFIHEYIIFTLTFLKRKFEVRLLFPVRTI